MSDNNPPPIPPYSVIFVNDLGASFLALPWPVPSSNIWSFLFEGNLTMGINSFSPPVFFENQSALLHFPIAPSLMIKVIAKMATPPPPPCRWSSLKDLPRIASPPPVFLLLRAFLAGNRHAFPWVGLFRFFCSVFAVGLAFFPLRGLLWQQKRKPFSR